MSDQDPQVGDENVDKPVVESSQPKEDQVPRKAYEDVSRDMHKYKTSTKDLRAKLNQIEIELKVKDEEELKEKQQWQKLYEGEKVEKEQLQEQHVKDQKRFVQIAKINALKGNLGEVKDSYLVHADLDSISLNDDGTVNDESLHNVANRFREEHGQLIPTSNAAAITNQAAPANVNVNQPKSLADMSIGEKTAALMKMREERLK